MTKFSLADVPRYPTFYYNREKHGGTEYMGRGFDKYIVNEMPKLNNYVCLIMPGIVPDSDKLRDFDGEIIYWLHNTLNQFGPDFNELFYDKEFQKKLKYIVVPSEAAKKSVVEDSGIDPDKVYVIYNAVPKLNYNPDKFKNVDKVKITFSSSPDRGMFNLLNSIQNIDEDFELEIFNDFNPEHYDEHSLLNDPRVTFYGLTPRKAMHKHIEQSHIYAYPTVFYETFCISMAEHLSAGCLPVYSNYGSLKEIANGSGLILNDLSPERDQYGKDFAVLLEQGIKQIKDKSWDPREQIEYVNQRYSWERIKQDWLDFHELL